MLQRIYVGLSAPDNAKREFCAKTQFLRVTPSDTRSLPNDSRGTALANALRKVHPIEKFNVDDGTVRKFVIATAFWVSSQLWSARG